MSTAKTSNSTPLLSPSVFLTPAVRRSQNSRVTELALSVLAVTLFVGGVYLCVSYNLTSTMVAGGCLTALSMCFIAWIIYRVTNSPVTKVKQWIEKYEERPSHKIVRKIAQYSDLLGPFEISETLAAALLEEFDPAVVNTQIVHKLMLVCREMNGQELHGICQFPSLFACCVNIKLFENQVVYLYSQMNDKQKKIFEEALLPEAEGKYKDRFSKVLKHN